LIFVLTTKCLEQLDDFDAAYFSKKLDFIKFARIKIARGVGVMLSVFSSVLIFESFYVAMIFATFIYLAFWFYVNRKYLTRPKPATQSEMIQVFSSMWSMGASSSIQSLATSGCRTYVGLAISTSALTVFGCISYLLTAVNLVTNALGTYYLPQFVLRADEKISFLKKIAETQVLVVILSVVLLVLVGALGEQALLFLFNEDIAKYSDGLFLLAISACFKASSNLVGTALTSTQKYTLQIWFTLFNIIFLTVFLFFYRGEGLLGIFKATLAATVLEWILMNIISIHYFYEYFKKKFN
jgi:O-antigen/teichoic acid export membrane protein